MENQSDLVEADAFFWLHAMHVGALEVVHHLQPAAYCVQVRVQEMLKMKAPHQHEGLVMRLLYIVAFRIGPD